MNFALEAFIAGKESEFADFQLDVIKAKQINAYESAKLRICYGAFKMTPQEELFKKFFNQEKEFIAVEKMDMTDLCARIEELQNIAFEARAKLSAANEEKREREAKGKKASGLLTSVAGDQLATDAINRVRDRQKKMDKNEKLRENLISLQMLSGLSRLDAEKAADQLMSASTLKMQKDEKYKLQAVAAEKPTVTTPAVIVNPFKKSEPVVETETKATEVIIQDDTVIIKTETVETEQAKPEPTFVNPFKR